MEKQRISSFASSLAAAPVVRMLLLGGLVLAALGAFSPGRLLAWSVCVNAGSPSPALYGAGTAANPYIICEGDQSNVTFTATVCNGGGNGECTIKSETFTWQDGTQGASDTVTIGPFSAPGPQKVTGTATVNIVWVDLNGDPCANPPAGDSAGSYTIYVECVGSSTWQPVAAPNPVFPPPPSVPTQTTTGPTAGYCGIGFCENMEISYNSALQPNIVDGEPEYSPCGGSVTDSTTISTGGDVTFGYSQWGFSATVDFGGTTHDSTSAYTAGPQAGLEFEIESRTPQWLLFSTECTRVTDCYLVDGTPGPYGSWSCGNAVEDAGDEQLPGITFWVFSRCCG